MNQFNQATGQSVLQKKVLKIRLKTEAKRIVSRKK